MLIGIEEDSCSSVHKTSHFHCGIRGTVAACACFDRVLTIIPLKFPKRVGARTCSCQVQCVANMMIGVPVELSHCRNSRLAYSVGRPEPEYCKMIRLETYALKLPSYLYLSACFAEMILSANQVTVGVILCSGFRNEI